LGNEEKQKTVSTSNLLLLPREADVDAATGNQKEPTRQILQVQLDELKTERSYYAG
jgi:hypothetical protein